MARLRLPEYFILGMFFLFLIFVVGFHLSYRFPTDLRHANIQWLLMISGLEIAGLPVVFLILQAVFKEVQSLRKGVPTASEEALVMQFHASHQREWQAFRRGISFLRDWLPIFVFMGTYWVFDTLPALLKIPVRDALLARWDLKLFGAHYSVAAQRFYSPWLTAVMNFCYFMHVVIFPLVLTLFYLKKQSSLFQRTMLFLIVAGFLGEIGYILVPAYGPYVYLHNLYAANFVRNPFVAAFIDFSRAPLDAFPSLHVAVSAGCLVYAGKYARWLFWILLPLVAGNWLSTVYLQYHYTVDLLAGFVVFGLAYGVTEATYFYWGRS